MFDFGTILQTPLIQLFAVALVIGFLQKMGIDVMALFKWFFTKNGNDKNQIAERLERIEGNDLKHIEQSLNDLQIAITKTLDILGEFKEYGIRIRAKK